MPFLWMAFPGPCHNQSIHASNNYTNVNNTSICAIFNPHNNPVRWIFTNEETEVKKVGCQDHIPSDG